MQPQELELTGQVVVRTPALAAWLEEQDKRAREQRERAIAEFDREVLERRAKARTRLRKSERASVVVGGFRYFRAEFPSTVPQAQTHQPERRPQTARTPRARRSRSTVRNRSPGSSDAGDESEPPQCGCGCGEPIPAGRRKFLDDRHADRQRQRQFRAGVEVDGDLAYFADLVWAFRRRGVLNGDEAVLLLIAPSERLLRLLHETRSVAA